jgi:hypothetical protein
MNFLVSRKNRINHSVLSIIHRRSNSHLGETTYQQSGTTDQQLVSELKDYDSDEINKSIEYLLSQGDISFEKDMQILYYLIEKPGNVKIAHKEYLKNWLQKDTGYGNLMTIISLAVGFIIGWLSK